jgi:hypothetical protein
MGTLREFDSERAARAYRHEHGTGGWIFVPDDGGAVRLYPPSWPPSRIFRHPTTRGLSGRLIGSA